MPRTAANARRQGRAEEAALEALRRLGCPNTDWWPRTQTQWEFMTEAARDLNAALDEREACMAERAREES